MRYRHSVWTPTTSPDRRTATYEYVPENPAPAGNRIRILRLAQVMSTVGLKRAAIYHLESAGKFPRKVKLTRTAVGWVEGEIQEWLAARIAESNQLRNPTAPTT